MTDDFQASVRERHWWYVFKRHVVKDVPARINQSGDSKKERGILNKCVLAILQGIRDARSLDDYPRVKLLRDDLGTLATKPSVPLQTVGAVCVPNFIFDQKAAIHIAIRKSIHSCTVLAKEKQALSQSVRIVRTNPHTARRIFEKHASKNDKMDNRPLLLHQHPSN